MSNLFLPAALSSCSLRLHREPLTLSKSLQQQECLQGSVSQDADGGRMGLFSTGAGCCTSHMWRAVWKTCHSTQTEDMIIYLHAHCNSAGGLCHAGVHAAVDGAALVLMVQQHPKAVVDE